MPWTFYNSNGQRLSSAATNISVLDIDGATDIGGAIADEDLFIIDDNASGTNRKTEASRLKTYVGAGALAFVGKATASDSSTLTVTGIDGTYENYLILGSDLVPATDHRQFQLTFGDSGGLDTGASDYQYHKSEAGSGSTGYGTARVDTAENHIELGNKVGNAAGEGLGFTLWLNMPGNGTMFATVHGTHVEWDKDGALIGGLLIGARVAVISLTQISIKLNAGNIGTG